MTNWLAAAGLTTTLPDVAEATPVVLVLKAIVIVSAVLYDRPLNVATPPANVTVSLLPCRLEVPLLRAAVTVCVLSVVMTLLNASSSSTTGWVANATPPSPWPTAAE